VPATPSAVTYSRYSTCLEYLIAFIKRLPHNITIKNNVLVQLFNVV